MTKKASSLGGGEGAHPLHPLPRSAPAQLTDLPKTINEVAPKTNVYKKYESIPSASIYTEQQKVI